MEAISGDTQGPFRVVSSEGTTKNVKFIDANTKYAKMFGVKESTAENTAELFKIFLTRLERRTGDKCKYFKCDDGGEFKGAFHDYLESIGIQKQRGMGYEHHYPGAAENLHKNIMGRARAMHIDSHLPIEYYLDSQLMGCYFWNREVPTGISVTP